MKNRLLLFSFLKSFSLHCDTVQQLRSGNCLQVFQHPGKMQYVMAVNRSEISELQCLEHIALLQNGTLDSALNLCCQHPCPVSDLVVPAEQVPDLVLKLVVGTACGDVEEIFLECADTCIN